VSSWALDPQDSRLVNDLDVTLVRESDGTVFRPWVLDPDDPAAPAIVGVNRRDNVEMIEATGAGAGDYRVVVQFTAGESAEQAFSLVQSGLESSVTGVDETELPPTPSRMRIAPNPFNPRTTVAFSLDESSFTTLGVYDARGRHLAHLFEGVLEAGEHRVAWDGCGQHGRRLAAGLYVMRLETNGKVDCRRVVLAK